MQTPREDPYNILLKRYMDMGYSREEVAMGLVIAGDETDNAEKVNGMNRGFAGGVVGGPQMGMCGQPSLAVLGAEAMARSNPSVLPPAGPGRCCRCLTAPRHTPSRMQRAAGLCWHVVRFVEHGLGNATVAGHQRCKQYKKL